MDTQNGNTLSFKGIYNNGTATGRTDVTASSVGYVDCSANSIIISDVPAITNKGCTINAILIYPAIYGDVTFS